MTKELMDFDTMSTNSVTKRDMGRYATRESSTRGSSTNNEKPLPNYLRASISSCHDFCKYGRKQHIEVEAKNFFLLKSDNKLSHREKPHEISNSIPEERRKKLIVKLKSSSTINKQKSKIKKEFAPTSENEESQMISITGGDHKKKQVIELKTINKSNSLSYKHKVGEQKNISHDNGIDSFQKSGITKNTSSPLEEAASSIGPELIKKTSLKNMTSKKISQNGGVGLLSPLAPSNKSTVQRNVEEYLKCGEIMDTLEKKIMKSSKSSPSLKHVANGNLSLKQKQYKFGKQTNFTKNQKFGKSKHDTRSNREKTMDATDKFSQNVDIGSAEESTEMQNVVSDSSKELLSKFENRDLKSLQRKLLDLENSGGMGMLGHKLQEFENVDMIFVHGNCLKPEEIIFESLEREPTNQKFVKSKNAIMDLHEEKLQKPDGIVLGTLELKHNDCNLLKQENSEMDFHEQNLKKTENIDLDLLELSSNDDQSAEEEIEESMSVHSKSTNLESEHEQEESNNTNENTNGGQGRARRNTVVHPQVELSTPHKLKFRRGKIIEPLPESSSLRRLRFRRRGPVDLSVTVGQSERKNFQRREKITERSDPNPNAAQSVMLKHQEQEKKDTQGLSNSIIEETASKLVECRKSKVKALVGAFETVISLQDSKPASTA